MVCKSKAFHELSRQHQNVVFDSPEILRIYHDPGFMGEKNTIYRLVNSIKGGKRKEWIKQLCSGNHGNFLGAWFEIMLYGWLKQRFAVTVEPKIEGCKPDYKIEIGDQIILIEAKAHLVNANLREERNTHICVYDTLCNLNKPYHFTITKEILGKGFDIEKFKLKVVDWLESGAKSDFVYLDEHNTAIVLTATLNQSGKASCISPAAVFYVNPYDLKRSLCEKTRQHGQLHKSKAPYIIALYLEDKAYSVEEVVTEWYGKETLNWDGENCCSACIELDRSGVVYQVAHLPFEYVSGILVFHSQYSDEEKSRTLSASYIENCFALHKVDLNIFPDLDKFVTGKKEDGFYKMKWVSGLH